MVDAKVRAAATTCLEEMNACRTTKGFEKGFWYLSNFCETPVTIDGVEYQSAEAAYQAGRCADKVDKLEFAHLDAAAAKKRAHHDIDTRPDWLNFRIGHMKRVVSEKFHQNRELAWALFHLDGELEETNDWHDNFWGNCTCPNCRSIPGENMLGKILMEVRDEIRLGIGRLGHSGGIT